MITGALVFLKGLPAWVWIAMALLIGGWYYGRLRYEAGYESVRKDWAASIEKGKAEIERLKKEAGKVTVRVETKTVEKIVTIREKARVIYQDREVFVPVDSGYLSGGFRLYFDAATENTIPDPAKLADAAPVAVADVADTYAYNAEQCHIAYGIVEGWQTWADQQTKLNPPTD